MTIFQQKPDHYIVGDGFKGALRQNVEVIGTDMSIGDEAEPSGSETSREGPADVERRDRHKAAAEFTNRDHSKRMIFSPVFPPGIHPIEAQERVLPPCAFKQSQPLRLQLAEATLARDPLGVDRRSGSHRLPAV